VSRLIKLADRDRETVWELPVLFHDPHLLSLNKPASLALNPHPGRTDVAALLPLLHGGIAAAKTWAREFNLDYLMPAHRLEAETSGVLLLARSREVLTALAHEFGRATTQQHYLALVRNGPPESRFELDAKLLPHPDHPGQMRSDSKRGRRYRTRCEVVERFRGYSLLHCLPTPGKPGQIAAHLRHARIPLVSDPYRGGAGIFLSQLKPDYEPKKGQEERPLIGRPALHLEKLELQHPLSSEPLTLLAPLAKDFTVALKYLRRFAG
jgi:23S rRNA-/tRNA-specific pseudouridylate synthase